MKHTSDYQAEDEQWCSGSKRAKVEEGVTSESQRALSSSSSDKEEPPAKEEEEEEEEEEVDWSSRAAYRDTPLILGDSINIRVLKILSEKPGGHIACQLSVIPVQGDVPFTAVSYVWGERYTRSLNVNDRPLMVRENLWQFLYQMHQEGRAEFFWIDAICINQFDTQERNHQVTMMGKIYATANQVIVWLGPEVEAPRHERLLNAIRITVTTRSSKIQRANELRVCLQRLSAKEYWRRTWILQEFILARQLEIRSGPDVLDENILHELCELIDGIEGLSVESAAGGAGNDPWRDQRDPTAMSIIQLRSTWGNRVSPSLVSNQASRLTRTGGIILENSAQPLSLLDLVGQFSNTSCMDPRDHVYAVLSLVDSEELQNDPIVPDYPLSAAQLLLQLTQRAYKERHIDWTKSDSTYWFFFIRPFEIEITRLAQVLGFESPQRESKRMIAKVHGRPLPEYPDNIRRAKRQKSLSRIRGQAKE